MGAPQEHMGQRFAAHMSGRLHMGCRLCAAPLHGKAQAAHGMQATCCTLHPSMILPGG